jgi:hypothetical protein
VQQNASGRRLKQMGTNLKPSVLGFFNARMAEHSRVSLHTRTPRADEYVFEIQRKDGLPTINVHVSDAYDYGLVDYLARPKQIGRGDFILIVRPEARFDRSLIERARKDGIGIGMIGKLMGALNLEDVYKYVPQDEKPKA